MLKNKSTPLKCWPIYCFKSKIYTGIELKTFDFSNVLFDFFGGGEGGYYLQPPPRTSRVKSSIEFWKRIWQLLQIHVRSESCFVNGENMAESRVHHKLPQLSNLNNCFQIRTSDLNTESEIKVKKHVSCVSNSI